jgi:hypothetical protein
MAATDQDIGDTTKGSPLPFVPESVLDLLLWTNPVHTAVVFGIGLLFFLMVLTGQFTVVQLLTLIVALHLTVCLLYVNGSAILFPNRDGSTKQCGVPDSAVLIAPEVMDAILRRALHSFNTAAVTVYNVYHCRQNTVTLQVLAAVVGVNVFAYFVSDATFLFLLFVLAFTAPKYYVANRSKCDRWIAAVAGEAQRLSERVAAFMRDHIPAMAARAAARQREQPTAAAAHEQGQTKPHSQ